MKLGRSLLLGVAFLLAAARPAPAQPGAEASAPTTSGALRIEIPEGLRPQAVDALPFTKEMSEDDPRWVLLYADQSRGNLEGISWRVQIQEGDGRPLAYRVKSRLYDFVARTRVPARYKGDTILMVKNNMWFYKKGTSRPVPVSQRQKLLGAASYGDIAATNYAQDYEVVALEHGAAGEEACWVFTLDSLRDRKTTYDRVKVWISKTRGVQVQAEYFTVSGKLIKTTSMTYDSTVEIEGEERLFISEILFKEVLTSRRTTTMTFTNPRLQRVPPSAFDLNLLRR